MAGEYADGFLLSELKAGNIRAYEKIFTDHYANLCRYANCIIHDEEVAQSLVQNVLLRLWENRNEFDKVTRLSAYLTTMVRNEALNYLKRQEKRIDISRAKNVSNSDDSSDNLVNQHEILDSLCSALNDLPIRCREAFEMSRFDNLTNHEIAVRMKISVKGVEALITRSLKILRAELIEFLPSSKEKKFPSNLILLLITKIKRVLAI